MILNRHRAQRPCLRVAIFSTPKTGNMWLRSLLRHAYGLPNVELRPDRSQTSFADLGPSWISHQHFFPSVELVGTLIREGITVLSTLRHPGDTLVSYFKYVGAAPNPPGSPEERLMLKDGGAVGANTLEYARRYFPAVYSHSLLWSELGARVVRYEDLFADPLAQLRELAPLLGQVSEQDLAKAVLLCRPDLFRVSTEVVPWHLGGARPHQWKTELTAPIIDLLRSTEPFVGAAGKFGYDWDPAGACPAFDYDKVDPFRGARCFSNGVPIAPFLVRVFAEHAPAPVRQAADATATGPGSFWEWLSLPSPLAAAAPGLPGRLLTNLIAAIHASREDLRVRYPDVVQRDRFNFAWLYLTRCVPEYGLPWELAQPVQQALLGHLGKLYSNA